jgi:hypothetical protein
MVTLTGAVASTVTFPASSSPTLGASVMSPYALVMGTELGRVEKAIEGVEHLFDGAGAPALAA